VRSSLGREIVDDGELHTVSHQDCVVWRKSRTDNLIATVVSYRAYETADTHLAVGDCNEHLYGILYDKLQKPEWKTDSRFITSALRVKHRDIIDMLVESELMIKTHQEWLEVFEGSGMQYAAINDIKGTIEYEHVLARNMKVDHPAVGKVKLVNHPAKYSRVEPKMRTPPPLLRQHTDEVLREMLGITRRRLGGCGSRK
jgi:succinate--hydroxymethylglutarate CoA-transferase